MAVSEQFLDLLYGEAPREAFDAVVTEAIDAGVDGAALQRLRDAPHGGAADPGADGAPAPAGGRDVGALRDGQRPHRDP